MPRETKEQKALRQAAEEQARAAEKAAYLATVPKRLFEMQCLASMLYGVTVTTTLTPAGPTIRFQKDENPYIDETLSYTSEEWEVDSLEGVLKQMKIEIDAKVARRVLAQETFDGLSTEVKAAIREHIHSLR